MEELKTSHSPYVAVLNRSEWQQRKDQFDMGIDFEPDESHILITKAVVNFDSITGTFPIPDRSHLAGADIVFSFALDEKGIVFIDEDETVGEFMMKMERTKKWKLPSLERFLYDFIELSIHQDQQLMEQYELTLDRMEAEILQEKEIKTYQINDIRSEIRDLRIHYDQLYDLIEVLEDNENEFFDNENLRYFRSL